MAIGLSRTPALPRDGWLAGADANRARGRGTKAPARGLRARAPRTVTTRSDRPTLHVRVAKSAMIDRRRCGVEAHDVQHAAVIRVGDAETVRHHSDHHQRGA